ncbi:MULTISPECIES: glycosyltransferase [Klebsiella]|uniref:glycosyltransferase n=1 Tax=Klebsiella TaxID=570 RepID=UPI0008A2BEF6|nr:MULTISPECIES: glycosyltransferase [Klebsiella]HBQ6249246.1 glycosyltransferase [Klebsiella variicola subsp. variicola]MCI4417832.1 glycosyltransferase [Klebsiella variicola]OFV44668.1 hypothetical protein HMPREF3142_02195 [Klebsiella sp. HMSC16C06]HBQ6254041.1 glycosyltransferase [Klebsiella variicola subsp. variicola]HBQ6646394.1 glycosyltransferase [Klebsiella variicola subsp. variicola]
MAKIIVVSTDCPYPANHGGRLDILMRLELLSSIGHEVDLIVTYKEEISEASKEYLKKICKNVYYVQRDGMIKSATSDMLKFLPLQIKSRAKLKEIKLNKKYDYVLCESEYVCSILNNATLDVTNKFLRVHNNEVVYYKALFKDERSVFKKAYYLYEMLAFKYNKKNINSSFDKLLFISKDECDKESRAVWLPSHMPVINPFKDGKFDTHTCNVLFVGNLFMPNNLQGLIWYLNNVHPIVIKENPDIKLTIAGNAKNGISEELKRAISLYDGKSIKLIASPSDKELQTIYDENCIFINPMLNGAGVKLKNLDAMRNSMFVVSTSIGAEGTGTIDGKQLVIANDEVVFANYIVNYSKDISSMKDIAFNAYSFIQNNYDSKKVFSRIFKEN